MAREHPLDCCWKTEHPHICQLKDKGWLFCWLDIYATWKSEKNASFLLCVIFFSTSFYTLCPNLRHFLAASNKPPLTSLDKHAACKYIIIYRYTTSYNNINCLNISEISSKYPLTIHQMSIRYPSSNYSLNFQGYMLCLNQVPYPHLQDMIMEICYLSRWCHLEQGLVQLQMLWPQIWLFKHKCYIDIWVCLKIRYIPNEIAI